MSRGYVILNSQKPAATAENNGKSIVRSASHTPAIAAMAADPPPRHSRLSEGGKDRAVRSRAPHRGGRYIGLLERYDPHYGHIVPNIEKYRDDFTFTQRKLLYVNQGGRLLEQSEAAGRCFELPGVGSRQQVSVL